MNDVKKILDELVELYTGYANERRAGTQPFNLALVKKQIPDYEIKHDDEIIRESLIEHVGSLPIIAAKLYPYINNKEVDLGHTLLLLAIHDIGEVEVGDVMTYIKDQKHADQEKEAALALLDPMYHELYEEAENKSSITAQFAKSVDKFAGDLLGMLTPINILLEKFDDTMHIEPSEIGPLIMKTTHTYMLWNPFMTELHLELVKRFERNLDEYLAANNN